MVHDRDLSLTPGASPLVNSTPRTFQDSADRFARLRGASIRAMPRAPTPRFSGSTLRTLTPQKEDAVAEAKAKHRPHSLTLRELADLAGGFSFLLFQARRHVRYGGFFNDRLAR